MSGQQYHRTSHTVYDNKYHIVWITKYRKKILVDDIALRLREIIRQICSTEKIDILKGAIGPDHVHILLETPPYIAISRIIQHLKGESSRKLQMEFPKLGKSFWGQHMWAIGYFCVTTGVVTEKVIKDYIEQQGKQEEEEDKTFQIFS
ncbi:MAG: IS200/IS605 family transposase [Patescibacteria group bacterium]|nr:IS200/IS605 family transposase [Patescibacteria group bacterium]